MSVRCRLKHVAQAVLYRTGLTDWLGGLGLRRKAGAYILFGHRVVGHDGGEHLCARQLSSLLGYLRGHFDVIPLVDVLDRLRTHCSSRRAAVALTFDDGYADNYYELLPILRAHQVPATVFVTSGPIDTQNRLWFAELRRCIMESAAPALAVPFLDGVRPLDSPCARQDAANAAVRAVKTGHVTADEALRQVMSTLRTTERSCTDTERMLSRRELRELAADPLVTIGAHTVSHPILANIPLDEAYREIDEGREKLADAIGYLPEVFAYPNGQPEDIPPEAIEHLRRSGWTCAVTTVPAVARRDDDPMLLPRLPLGSGPPERLAWSLARAAHRV
jgi:peptidoglycan/xylan/chitin deacetylase (PgdA/CDA1 family)